MPTVVTTRSLDPADKESLRRWHAAALTTHRHDLPESPFWTADDAVAVIRPDDPEERFVPVVAEDADGSVVGTGIVFVPLLDNLEKASFVLGVDPGHRGRGVGDVLMAHVLEVVRAEGRAVVLGEGNLPVDHDEHHPVRRFAARHGFSLANTELRRMLRLPVPEATIQSWLDDAAAHHEGYHLATYVDELPAELRPSLVALLNQLAVDAPTGEIEFEAGAMTEEMYDENMRRRVATGRRVFETVAVRDGVVVAHSTLSVPPGDEEMPHLNQWGTFVHRDHRGHRLGLAVKAANLRAVQRLHPERTLVTTTNSPANAPMVAINELMGFRPVNVFAEFLRRL
jgi:GNAT superfamily N-acetyltransferase